MVYLPPKGILSDVSCTNQIDIDEMAKTLLAKTQNEKVYDEQLIQAQGIFKKAFNVGRLSCSIIELEFYFGEDPYLFSDYQLFQPFRFYFRRRAPKDDDPPEKIQPNGSVFVHGKKRGLCVTMGTEQFQSYILIRSIMTPAGVVEGAAAVLDFVVENMGVKTVEDLNRGLIRMLEIHNASNPAQRVELSRDLVPCYLSALGLALVDVEAKDCPYQGERIYHGPRVGLTLKNETEYYGKYSMYVMKPYRFTYRGGLLKIAKHYFALTARLHEVPDFTIQEDLKVSGELVGRWSSYFTRGETASVDILMQPGNLNLDDVKKQCTAYGFFSRFNK